MKDFLSEIRAEMIENLQISLRAIRLLMGYSAAELAAYVGVTRQTINNLETGKAKMSPMQFISIAAVVDHYTVSNGEMFQAIEAIIDGNYRKANRSYDTSFSSFSLLKRWFASFDNPSEWSTRAESLRDTDLLVRKLVGNYKIFLDADVLLTEGAEKFVMALTKQLSAEKAEVIVPLRAVEQLQELTQDMKASEQAIRALRLISLMQHNTLVQIRGEENDSTLHDTIMSVFTKFRSMHRLCLFTQDKAFAEDVLHLNRTPNVQGFDILVGHVDEQGRIVLYSDSVSVPELEVEKSFDAQVEAAHKEDDPFNLEKLEEECEIDLSDWAQL